MGDYRGPIPFPPVTLPLNPSRIRSPRSSSFLSVTGQVPGGTASHTASDIPLSAYGRGAALFSGTMDNTDVFFRMMKAAIVGADNTIAER